MSARRSAGASLTPSPVIATVSPCARSASAIRSFASGEVRAKTSSRPSASRRSSAVVAHRVELARRRRRRRRSTSIPTARATSSAVSPWSPVITMMRIPARWQLATAAATSGRGGSSSATRPRSSRSRSTRVARPARRRVEPPARRARARAGPRRRAPRPRRERRSARGRVRRASQRGEHALRARPWCRRRGRRRRSSHGRHQLPPESKANSATGGARASTTRTSRPAPARTRAAPPRSGRPRVGSPSRRPPRRCCTTRPPPPGRPRRPTVSTTRIRFSVSVPVLSVQITVVEPSVSTALSRLTSAPLAGQRADADGERERDRRQQPLGDVGDEQADREDERLGERQARRAGRAAGTRGRRPTATSAISYATRRTWCSSGLSSRPTRSDSAAIRPSSVCMPVAKTSARARPPVQLVPLNTRSRASSRTSRLRLAGLARRRAPTRR